MQEQEVEPRRCCWQRQEDMETSGFVMASGPVDADCRRRDRALEARGLCVCVFITAVPITKLFARVRAAGVKKILNNRKLQIDYFYPGTNFFGTPMWARLS